MPIRTLSELIGATLRRDKPDCFLHKVDGRYVPIPTREFAARVRRLAAALDAAGVRPGDRIAQMAENGPHWPTVDFAALALGAVHVPIYPTLLPEGAAYIVRDSGARILFVQGAERTAGLVGVRDQMPSVERIVVIGEPPLADGVTGFEELLAGAPEIPDAQFDAWLARARPEDLATLIYTSGTTGDPKGVMLTHGNLASNVEASCKALAIQPGWTALSFLPLAHSFERTVTYIYLNLGVSIAYAESVQAVAQNLAEVRPHIFVSVPRIYEKVMARAWETARAAGGLRHAIFRWAVKVGRQHVADRIAERPPSLRLRIADKLVFAKIRARLGGRFEMAASGGAPLARDVAEFFWGAGVRIFEGYGLTETSPVLTVNRPRRARLGSVGEAIEGVELRIAEDGEILARGPGIMRGYFGKPEATAEVIDADGWFHTGDIGNLDADGYLFITDRKKELLVNAYGKNIAPAPIENALKESRWISQAVVVGDRRQYLSALIVPDFEALRTWAAGQGIAGEPATLIAEPRVRALVAADVAAVNSRLARYEQVRNWDLLPAEFTLEGGELTPTLKVKRRVINSKYKELLDRLYADAEAGAG
ncbi:MAG: long-chain fatty acid--CoA ligase [Thermoanaerobaculia bacterium]|nr:MAG: long-chain fatty acid--CoA ligase [Thermoanaerobaculia bacterium]MBZ0101401.1 long-chain fatty acid--CoA ligase [Thermoanaerobaculia bacterium]